MKAKQEFRLLFLCLYVIVFCGINAVLYGNILPNPGNATGLWFYSGLLGLLLGDLLLEPYFTSPKDAIANSITAFTQVIVLAPYSQTLWIIGSIIAIVPFVAALIAIVWKDSSDTGWKEIALVATNVANLLGKARVLFTVSFLLIVFSFNNSFNEAFVLLTTWIVVFAGRPIERLHDFFQRTFDLFSNHRMPKKIGTVVERRHPGLMSFELTGPLDDESKFICVILEDKKCEYAYIIDSYQLSNGNWIRAICFEGQFPHNHPLGIQEEPGTVLVTSKKDLPDEIRQQSLFRQIDELVGFIVERSDNEVLQIEQVNEEVAIAEGQLFVASIRGSEVLYQVTSGEVNSEQLTGKNRQGYTCVKARKLGRWDKTHGCFEHVEWLPQIYSSVLLHTKETAKVNEKYVGYIPNTTYGIEIDCNRIVTHNTAILGVVGSGKSYLAFELIDRIASSGIKCLVVDITGEYRNHLSRWTDNQADAASVESINKKISAHRGNINQNKASGGNQTVFREAIRQELRDFLSSDVEVRIYNPLELDVTYQTSGVFGNSAGIDDCTPSQITSIIVGELLWHAKNDGTSLEAKYCLVLEEAHSLVPEWQSVTVEGEKTATMATARAILQGRKYGLGSLIVAQRTANVTKSILNQCNTVFAMQTFDITGMNFLANYVGADYSQILSSLKPRTCIACGFGVNLAAPVMLELNDRDEFLKEFHFPERDLATVSDDTSMIPF